MISKPNVMEGLYACKVIFSQKNDLICCRHVLEACHADILNEAISAIKFRRQYTGFSNRLVQRAAETSTMVCSLIMCEHISVLLSYNNQSAQFLVNTSSEPRGGCAGSGEKWTWMINHCLKQHAVPSLLTLPHPAGMQHRSALLILVWWINKSILWLDLVLQATSYLSYHRQPEEDDRLIPADRLGYGCCFLPPPLIPSAAAQTLAPASIYRCVRRSGR
jgi:hypothetical protein